MTSIAWTISSLDCAPLEGDRANVVKTAHWRCTGTDETFGGTAYGACSFPAPGEEFTAYEGLTPEVVLGWCWANGVDKDATEAAVQAQIDAAKNPPIVSPALPWL